MMFLDVTTNETYTSIGIIAFIRKRGYVVQINNSEVARLREQIELTCQAMHLGMHGYAAVASHQTITNSYKTLGQHQEQLATFVGPEEAERIVVETYNRVMR